MGTEMFFMKFGGNITESGQEDELNSEKCGAGGHSGKTLSYRPRNRCIGRQLIGRRTLEMRLKQSRLAAMMFKILYRQKKMLLSVVQTSVEVTESSLL